MELRRCCREEVADFGNGFCCQRHDWSVRWAVAARSMLAADRGSCALDADDLS